MVDCGYSYLSGIELTDSDKIDKDLQNITELQAKFNKWFKSEFHFHGSEDFLQNPVKLNVFKCLFWPFLPKFVLGSDDIKFRGWSIGHCLNCDASPYDCQVEAWSYDGYWYRGALLRCNKCGQLRWQPGECGTDY